jgi:membrane associated rhomboid family serine protease
MAIEDTVALYTDISQEEANTYALVLTSYGIAYVVQRTARGWELRVADEVREKALSLIEAYLEENPAGSGKEEAAAGRKQAEKTFTGVWVSLFVLGTHLARLGASDPSLILRQAGAGAEPILSGEFFRTLTALTVHADFLHLAGNLFGIALFGTAVCHLTGAGLAWLMILVSGMLGNLANAWLFQSDHLSVGASTAVFGAVGILGAVQACRRLRLKIPGFRAWLPLAAGLALLAFLGAGRHSDVTAHLFGFLAGALLGSVFELCLGAPPKKRWQRRFLALSAAAVALSWLAALS